MSEILKNHLKFNSHYSQLQFSIELSSNADQLDSIDR